eukprot:11820271-Alexandrium_andersonii.AAC.1
MGRPRQGRTLNAKAGDARAQGRRSRVRGQPVGAWPSHRREHACVARARPAQAPTRCAQARARSRR